MILKGNITVYYKYIKELHKHASKEIVLDSVVNILLSPFIYILFMIYMLLNIKGYKTFKKNNADIV